MLWLRQCLEYGLPDYLIQDEDPVSLFLAARRQRHYIAGCKYKIIPDPNSDLEVASCTHSRQVVYAGNGVVVNVMFSPRKSCEEASNVPGRGEGSINNLGGTSFTPYNELKQLYQFEYLLIEHYNMATGGREELARVALEDKWRFPVISDAVAASDKSWVVLRIKETWVETAWYKIMTRTSNPMLLHLPDFSSVHHPSNPYTSSCCSKCSTVALVKHKLSMRPPWECSIDILHISNQEHDQQIKSHTIPILNYDKLRLSSDIHANVAFRPFVFSQHSRGDLCTSHKLVLWRTNDHVITVHNCSEEGISKEPEATFIPVPQGKTLELSTAWGHAKVKISADFQLLGFLISRHLHLWSLKTNEKLRTVYYEGIPGLRSWIFALGHVYSLFGTFYEGGELVVVSTQTNKVVWKCESFLVQVSDSSVTPMMYSSILHEDWMNDVHKLCPVNIPYLIYMSSHHLSAVGTSALAFTL